jgi:DNA invertase Pin-like site-specific DNA recombinase
MSEEHRADGSADQVSTTPVVAYARISADLARDAHGVQDQHKLNRETAEQLGWKIIHEFTDNDRSASKANVVRLGFEEMLQSIKAGHLLDGSAVRGVVVVNDDRLVRRSGDYERFVEALTFQDGRVYADARGPKDLYSEDVEGLGLVGVAFSKIETRKKQRRMRRSHRARAEVGSAIGGHRPFGWQTDRLTLDPIEAPLVRKAVQDFLAGRSLTSILKEWQQLDLQTTLGNPWSGASLKKLLANPRLCGWRRLHGELVTDGDGRPVAGKWAPIVTADEWMAVDAIMTARKNRAVHPDGRIGESLPVEFHEHKYLLGGILRCGRTKEDGSVCGARLRVTHQRHCKQHIYACPNKSGGGCGGLGRRGDKVDEYVTEAVLAKLEERHARVRAPKEWSGAVDLANQEAKLGVLREQWQADQISNELFFSTAKAIEERIRVLRNERNQHAFVVQRVAAQVNNLRERWHNGELDLSQKRAYVREALHAVIVRSVGGGRKPFDPNLLELIWRE